MAAQSLFSWLTGNKMKSRRARKNRQPKRRCQLAVEALEDRRMPAMFTVNTLADTIDTDPNVTSLREAVRSANAEDGPDEVNFASGLEGAIVLTMGRIRITSPLTITAPDLNEVTVIGMKGKAFEISASSDPVTIDEQLTVMDGHRATANLPVRPRLTSVTSVDPTTLVLDFNTTLGPSAARVSSYVIPGLTIKEVAATKYPNRVVLTTSPQEEVPYTVSLNNLRDRSGNLVRVLKSAEVLTGSAEDREPPRVVGAVSLGNNKVLVSFSEPMADNALNPAYYAITQASAGSEGATLPVREDGPACLFYGRTAVVLTTLSQSELTYTVKVVNVTDLAGNPFAPAVLAGGQRIVSDQTNFTGTPPSGDQLVDNDGDGLTDNEEVRGWQVTFKPANYQPQTRWVTSDPFSTDTDGDGFTDDVEKQLVLDPRDQDTDDDLLTDWQEYTEVFSDHLSGDSDGDGVDDGTEFLGVFSSPVFADTDGDQIPDGLEIPLGGARNILVSDLPRPEITVGNVNLQLDVRFTESNDHETRDLGTESFRTTLANASTTTETNQHTVNVELTLGTHIGTEVASDSGVEITMGVSAQLTAGYTYNYTHETADETRQEYEKSLQTEREVTQGFSVERSVQGASMQVAIDLSNLSDLAYRVKNLQVTAFIQDPLNHARLTPIATLVPDFEPEDGFTLGPLVANHGPIIFSNTTIIPSLVESLMANSTGLIFRISNYDIVAENDRNFAFASQEVVERTGAVLIDFGGAGKLLAEVNGEDVDDTNPPRQSEIHRVATSSGRVIDTNEDGLINEDDRRVTFDLAGKEVGITLRSALGFIGLTHYDESTGPGPVTTEEKLNSYSTKLEGGVDRIVRIRDIANDTINDKYWEILGPQGIMRDVNLDTLILNAGKTISLNFVQDLDQDGLPADVEYFLRTSDSPEVTVDWSSGKVPAATGFFASVVSFNSADLLNVATGDRVQVSASGGGLTAGVTYFINRFDLPGSVIPLYSFYTSKAAAVAGDPADRVLLTDNITATIAPASAPRGLDTDGDGLDDRFESLIGWEVTTPQRTYQVYSSPNRADSNFDSPKPDVNSDSDGTEDRFEYDGSDRAAAPAGWNDTNNNGLRDKDEVSQMTGFYDENNNDRLDPGERDLDLVLDPIRKDTDGDGIDDATEVIGFWITPPTDDDPFVRSTDPNTAFSDGDTFSDGFERLVGLDPRDGGDTDKDGDGLSDLVETTGWAIGKEILVADLTRGGVPDDTIDWQDLVVFNSDPHYATGTPVGVSDTGGGLTAGTHYFVGNHAAGFYGFYTSKADAVLATNRVELTGTITASVYPFKSVRGVEGVSLAPYQAGPGTQRTAKSRTDSVDSDGDGLTDYEEYFLKTDPSSKDTDRDNIDDRAESLGYTLGHMVAGQDLGIIKTDPLDADTDNDKRYDGAEAELVDIELNRWVVRLAGKTPYRVYSNPLVADADYDGLVDGDEFGPTYRTDPHNFNTDDDRVNDGREFVLKTNPLVKDQKVVFTILSATADTVPEGLPYTGSGWDDGAGEWGGSIYIQKDGEERQEVFVLGELNGTLQSETLPWGKNACEFTIQPGEVIRVFSMNAYENDGAGPDDPFSIDLTEFSEMFNDGVSSLNTTTKTLTLANTTIAKLTFLLQIKVLT